MSGSQAASRDGSWPRRASRRALGEPASLPGVRHPGSRAVALHRARPRALCALLALLALLIAAPRASAALPPVKHVFVIALENENEATSFGPGAPSPYLAQTLPSEGVFVPNYYAVGHASLDNYIAMISGQAPNKLTREDCKAKFTIFSGPIVIGENEQVEGEGCVYPNETKTLPEQLEEAGDSWKGYMQSMPRACAHPFLNAEDKEQGEGTLAEPNDTYATRHDPFMWFKSIIERETNCEHHVVNLEALPTDLEKAETTPSFSFITPDVCSDGHDSTCKNKAEPAGFAGINGFLKTWVPRITGSPAYKEDGLLIVTFDEATGSDTSACCGETTSGGGQVGAVMLSPYITPGITSPGSYNHYSMLASIEDFFGLPLIGDTKEAGTTTFESAIFGPTVLTGAASSVTQSTATLNASVRSGERQITACNFEYGKTTSYGSSAPCSPSPGAGSSAVAVSASVSGLAAASTYHFRIVATNAGGTSDGGDQQFQTLPSESRCDGVGLCLPKPHPPTLVCPSGRSVTIKLPSGKKRLSHVTVTANKHKVKVLGKKHPEVIVSMLGRSQAQVTVVVKARQGKHAYKAVHHYKSCHLS